MLARGPTCTGRRATTSATRSIASRPARTPAARWRCPWAPRGTTRYRRGRTRCADSRGSLQRGRPDDPPLGEPSDHLRVEPAWEAVVRVASQLALVEVLDRAVGLAAAIAEPQAFVERPGGHVVLAGAEVHVGRTLAPGELDG